MKMCAHPTKASIRIYNVCTLSNLYMLGRYFMTLKNQLMLLTLTIGIIALIQSIAMHFNNSSIITQAQKMEQVEVPILNKAHQLKLATVQVQQWLTDISATRGLDGLNDGFDEAENNAKLFRQLVAELSALDPKHKQQYDDMLPVFEKYYTVGIKMAQAYVAQGPAGGNALMADFDEAAASISETIESFLVSVSKRMTNALTVSNEKNANSSTIILIGASLIIIMMLLSYRFAHLLSARMTLLTQMMDTVARQGQFHHRLNIKGQDEVSSAGHSFNQLMTSLQEAIQGTSTVLRGFTQGEFDQKMDKSLPGDLGDLRCHVNNTADIMATTIGTISGVMAQVSQGDFSARVDAEMEGDLKRLQQNINQSVENLASAIKDINSVMADFADGELNHRVTLIAQTQKKTNRNYSVHSFFTLFLPHRRSLS